MSSGGDFAFGPFRVFLRVAMRTFSRWMPKYVNPPLTRRQRVVLGALALGATAGFIWSNGFRMVVAGLSLLTAVAWFVADLRLRRLSAKRTGEDIGTFVKAFDRRVPDFDPGVVRAVWDALQPYRKHRGGFAPLRASDRLHSFMDVDDTYDVVAVEVAHRSRRSLDGMENNLKFSQIETVGDMVEFFWAQPKLPDPPRPPANRNG